MIKLVVALVAIWLLRAFYRTYKQIRGGALNKDGIRENLPHSAPAPPTPPVEELQSSIETDRLATLERMISASSQGANMYPLLGFIREHFAGMPEPSLTKSLIGRVIETPGHFRDELLRTIFRIDDGSETLTAVHAIAAGIEGEGRLNLPMSVRWQIAELNFDQACIDFAAAGIMENPDAVAIEELIADYGMEDNLAHGDELDKATLFVRILQRSPNAITIDGGSPGKDVDYSQLFEFLFSRAAPNRKFEMHHEKRADSDDPAQLAFSFENAQYEVSRDDGWSIDVYWATLYVNEILSKHAVSPRVLTLACDDDNSVFLVAEPQIALPLLARYQINAFLSDGKIGAYDAFRQSELKLLRGKTDTV